MGVRFGFSCCCFSSVSLYGITCADTKSGDYKVHTHIYRNLTYLGQTKLASLECRKFNKKLLHDNFKIFKTAPPHTHLPKHTHAHTQNKTIQIEVMFVSGTCSYCFALYTYLQLSFGLYPLAEFNELLTLCLLVRYTFCLYWRCGNCVSSLPPADVPTYSAAFLSDDPRSAA